MRIVGMAGTYYEGSGPDGGLPDPAYLGSYDPRYRGGRGRASLTSDVSKALRYDSAEAVLRAWRAVNPERPTREDGRPNRPLTAYTITPEEVQA
jgi:hypothetical protein